MAHVLAPKSLVNAVAPGPFQSKMMAATLDAVGDQLAAGTPVQRACRSDGFRSPKDRVHPVLSRIGWPHRNRPSAP
ncbi:hypothetical protein [Mycolicibacterium sp.]|uniref:hypothetical protein n=1 Tax=Mycolicibacterium sp. TaxID=2320850 RepID=UPI00355F13B7